MREELLHCLWKYKKIGVTGLHTTTGEELVLIHTGMHNQHAGPDFFNARVAIGDQQWAGNVEIHKKSSDWYVHGHEKDVNYDNVILHVVWEHDAEIFRKDDSVVPVLELKKIVPQTTLQNYRDLLEKTSVKWINCENDFDSVEDMLLQHWQERLYLERLERKSGMIFKLLESSSGNWEAVFFKMLAKNFGLNVNGEAFLAMAGSVPFSVVRKVLGDRKRTEALFLGQAGLLGQETENVYCRELQREYRFLKNKFKLMPSMMPMKFFRLRPDNFPNIRLVQLAAVYCKSPGLFSEVMNASDSRELYSIFEIVLNEFWETHYSFEKSHSRKRKVLSRKFIDLLIINTVVPLKFCYSRIQGNELGEELLEMMNSLEQESNKVIKKFNRVRPGSVTNALQSQAMLQLKNEYCDKNRCLHCRIGLKLLHRQVQI